MRILNTVQKSGAPNALGWIVLALLAVTVVVQIVVYFTLKSDRKKQMISIVCMCIFIAYLIAHIICEFLEVDPFSLYKTQYECILEEDATTDDIPDEYKVVDVRGDIVVVEKSE